MGGKFSSLKRKKQRKEKESAEAAANRSHPYDEIDDDQLEANRLALAAATTTTNAKHSSGKFEKTGQNELPNGEEHVYNNDNVKLELERHEIDDLYAKVNKPKKKKKKEEPPVLNYVDVVIVPSSSHNAPRPEVKSNSPPPTCTYSEIIPSNGKFIVASD